MTFYLHVAIIIAKACFGRSQISKTTQNPQNFVRKSLLAPWVWEYWYLFITSFLWSIDSEVFSYSWLFKYFVLFWAVTKLCGLLEEPAILISRLLLHMHLMSVASIHLAWNSTKNEWNAQSAIWTCTFWPSALVIWYHVFWPKGTEIHLRWFLSKRTYYIA